MTTTLPTIAHQSRWGYHPCDYGTFLKLRALSKAYWQAVRQLAAWRRWQRKAPHNRVSRPRMRDADGRTIGYGEPTLLPEPQLPFMFAIRWTSVGRVFEQGSWLSREVVHTKLSAFAEKVLHDRRRAAFPAASPLEVESLQLTLEEIETAYATLQANR